MARSLLKIELRAGESVSIGELATITLESKSGKVARIAIEADKSIPVNRVGKATMADHVAKFGIGGKPVVA